MNTKRPPAGANTRGATTRAHNAPNTRRAFHPERPASSYVVTGATTEATSTALPAMFLLRVRGFDRGSQAVLPARPARSLLQSAGTERSLVHAHAELPLLRPPTADSRRHSGTRPVWRARTLAGGR